MQVLETALCEYLRALGEAGRRLRCAQPVLPNTITTHNRVTAHESDRDSGLQTSQRLRRRPRTLESTP